MERAAGVVSSTVTQVFFSFLDRSLFFSLSFPKHGRLKVVKANHWINTRHGEKLFFTNCIFLFFLCIGTESSESICTTWPTPTARYVRNDLRDTTCAVTIAQQERVIVPRSGYQGLTISRRERKSFAPAVCFSCFLLFLFILSAIRELYGSGYLSGLSVGGAIHFNQAEVFSFILFRVPFIYFFYFSFPTGCWLLINPMLWITNGGNLRKDFVCVWANGSRPAAVVDFPHAK